MTDHVDYETAVFNAMSEMLGRDFVNWTFLVIRRGAVLEALDELLYARRVVGAVARVPLSSVGRATDVVMRAVNDRIDHAVQVLYVINGRLR